MNIAEYNEMFRSSIRDALMSHRDKGYLVANRKLAGNFYHTFAESIFEYEVGVVLLERFYLKSNAESTDLYYKKLSENDLQKAKDIKDELRNILGEHIADDGNMIDRQRRIDELTEKSKEIKIDAAQIQAYKYKGIPLVDFDLYTDEDISSMSDLYSAFAINMTLFLGMQTLMDYSVAVSTIDHGDYIDLILIPAQKRE